MEIIPYQEEHRIFREAFCKFLEKEIVPHVDQWEEEGIVPRWAWEKLGSNGFLCTAVPVEYGGQNADFLYSAILIEEMARANFYGLSARLHSDVVVPYLLQLASEEYSIARAWRDIRITRILAGSNEIMKQIIAKAITQ